MAKLRKFNLVQNTDYKTCKTEETEEHLLMNCREYEKEIGTLRELIKRKGWQRSSRRKRKTLKENDRIGESEV